MSTTEVSANTAVSDAASAAIVLRVGWLADIEKIGHFAPIGQQAVEVGRHAPRFINPMATTESAPLGIDLISKTPYFSVTANAEGVVLRPTTPDSGDYVRVAGRNLTEAIELDFAALDAGVVINLGRTSVRAVFVLARQRYPMPEPSSSKLGLLGLSDAMSELLREVKTTAAYSRCVLLRGPTGTGKSHVAKLIHRLARSRGPFVHLNAATLQSETAPARLFGHTKGAFTGADTARLGSFKQADGGVLFLDEVAALPLNVQKQLLVALDDGMITPEGSNTPQKVDVFLVSATDAELDHELAEKRFSEALYHRISRDVITIPPLRQRRVDIGPLLASFLKAELETMGIAGKLVNWQNGEKPWIRDNRLSELFEYAWPGNVRQLQSVAHRIAHSQGGASSAHLGEIIDGLQPVGQGSPTAIQPPPSPVDEPNDAKQSLLEAFIRSGCNAAETARELGISRSTLYNRFQAVGITDDELERVRRQRRRGG